jgi:hypothetical protein
MQPSASPLDGEIALSHKLSDSGARILVTSNLSALLPTALQFLDKGFSRKTRSQAGLDILP